MKHSIVILDFGSQYTQLIARRIRELGVYTEIYPFSIGLSGVKELEPSGIILSGGPSSVTDPDAPLITPDFFDIGVPILGICYGMQLMSKLLGGQVEQSTNREYGRAKLVIGDKASPLFKHIAPESVAWMSHGDSVVRLAPGFVQTATTSDNDLAAIENHARKIYAVQFHPEVAHTEQGKQILSNFIFEICGIKKNWSMQDFVDKQISEIRETCANKKVILGVSGGVDSTTLAVLINKAIGDHAESVFVNNGLLRWDEENEVQHNLRERLGLNIRYIDASKQFLDALAGEKDPEKKRKAIGKMFIDVFWGAVKDFDYLVQGTLYPDVIESAPVKGPSRTIKTHHNRVAEVEKLEKEGRILEPFRFLFKDEVREVAKLLGMPDDILNRHPFPGPGLAVRVIDDITPEKLDILRRADKIFIDALHRYGWYDKVWQAFAVFMPVRSVGVMGDERAYGNVIGLRAVTSVDGMTANWAHLPYELLDEVGNTIVRQIREVNRVVYDITSKPPATIEWE